MSKALVKKDMESKVFVVRGLSVMLDRDLAALYGVPTKRINEAVKRNKKRFPEHYMFQLTKDEAEILKSQIATSSWGGARTLPYAFTEQGVAMLSSVLNSERAIEINIQIIDTFIALRRYSVSLQNEDRITSRLGVLEKALLSYMDKNDKRVDEIIAVLNVMLESEDKPEKEIKRIGFVK
jgi:hypothetical protein